MSLGLRASTYSLHVLGLRFGVSDWPKNEIKVETFRIDNPIRTPKVEKLRLQPLNSIRFRVSGLGLAETVFAVQGLVPCSPHSSTVGTCSWKRAVGSGRG